MKIRLAAPLQSDSIVDGEGIRTVIWTQGCSHNCKGCHNPETHDFYKGFEMDTEEIKEKLSHVKNQDGVTLSGGDPFFQPDASLDIAQYCKSHNLNVWCYTGFTFEQLTSMSKTNPSIKHFMENIDVLVDGKFEESKKSLNLFFRGSSNQRVLDLPKSLAQNKPIELQKFVPKRETQKYDSFYHTSKGIYI